MSWLSHFTGWVGEKKGTILPIVTGLTGFVAGMIPGIGGGLAKQIDKWGNKIAGGAEAIDKLGLGGGPASPDSAAVQAVEPASAPTTSDGETVSSGFLGLGKKKPAPASNTPMLIGLGVLAVVLLGGGNRR